MGEGDGAKIVLSLHRNLPQSQKVFFTGLELTAMFLKQARAVFSAAWANSEALLFGPDADISRVSSYTGFCLRALTTNTA